jgi:hypothetical protein
MARIPFQAGTPKTFTPMPKGTYCLRIDDVEEQTSKSNNPMLKITHLVEDHATYAGRKVIRFFSLSPKATFRLRAMLEAAIPDKVEIVESGDTNDDGDPLFNVDFDTDDLIGAAYYADAIVKYDKERDQENNEWRNERPLESASAASEEDEEDEEEEDAEEEAEDDEEVAAAAAKAEAAKKAKAGAAAGKGAETKGAAAQAGKGGGKPSTQTNGGKTQQSAGRERTRLRA